MFSKKFKFVFFMSTMGLLLLFTNMAWAQDEPSECVEMGAMAYENWTKMDAGGTGSLPEGVENQDYIRCKACHGWDHQGTDGGYVRRSRKDTRSNAGAGDGDSTSRIIETGTVTAGMIAHAGTGRSYAEGSGSWVALNEMHSSSNKSAHANGYTLGNQHPDLSGGDMTQAQMDCITEFLNFADSDHTVYFADIDTSQNPVKYTIVESADAMAGEAFWNDSCSGCHDLAFAVDYLQGDGKFSELAHKARWGSPDTSMSRGAMGDPTSQNIIDLMLYLQMESDTGFAMTPGMTGTWWNGPERSGEGFPVEVGFRGDGAMVLWVTFFTYNNMGHQTWLTAQGTVNGPVVDVEVFMPQGRMWGHDFDPAEGESTPWGTGTFSFTSCTGGHMLLEPNDDMMGMMGGFTDLEYDLKRFDEAVIPGIDCPN